MKSKSLMNVGGIILFIVLLLFFGLAYRTASSPGYAAITHYNQCMETLKESKSVTPETIAECKTLLPRQ